MERRELLGRWLRDAHSMELAMLPVLRNHAKDMADHPEIVARIESHVEETERHAEVVKSCLESIEQGTSALKDVGAKVGGGFQAVSTDMFKDEPVKNALADYAAEHMEIASYKALISAAEELGETKIASELQEILAEEEAMAEWLDTQLPALVEMTVQALVEEPEPAFYEQIDDASDDK
jgi:ferritin-like metal-binding protein YciE